MKIWLNGKIVAEQHATTSVLSHALHYGTAAFEGIRFYKTKNGSAVYRLEEHLKRLRYSAQSICIKIPWSLTTLKKAVLETIRANKLRKGYIRPIVWLGKSSFSLLIKGSAVDGAIIVIPWGKYLGKEMYALKTVSVRRFSPKAFNPNAKIAGPYVNAICALMEARGAGYDEALLLDQNDLVAEGSGENIFIVKKGTLFTPPTGNILPGITRDSIITIAKDLKIKMRIKKLTLKECYTADECFLTGTAAEVTPVHTIDSHTINGKKIGDITYALKTIFESIVRGKVKKYNVWLTDISK